MTTDDLRQRLDRLERLRKLGVKRGARDLPPPPPPLVPPLPPAPAQSSLPADLPGAAVNTPFGPTWVRAERYSLNARPDLAAWLRVSSDALTALGQDPNLATLDPRHAIFLDTETTGLSLGTDTYTFMIGIGTYEADAFIVRQFFMRHPGEERAQLHLVNEILAGCTGLVSFNGRGFDVPLVQNRFVLARLPFPWIGAPHLDLLPPARRVWRARIGSCRLSNLEQAVLGVQRTVEDVPGYLIPDIYREYYRTGAATEMLARVFYHNLIDITTMPILAARLACHFEPADPVARLADLHPLECASLGRCYLALNWVAAAHAAYRVALTGNLADAERADVLRDLGLLLKRSEQWAEAAAVWEEWISTTPGADVTPYVELAKYHEWRTADLAAARGWAAWALRIADGWPPGLVREELLTELQHRLARLERKLADG